MLDFWVNALSTADKQLEVLMNACGPWVYALFFLIIFLEGNAFFGPFLPGDTLVLACGALSASGQLDTALAFSLLLAGALGGYLANYFFGSLLRHYWHKKPRKHNKASARAKKIRAFFSEHLRLTVFFARFIPLVRSMTPMVAGMNRVDFRLYAIYSIIGGVFWVSIYFLIGYLVVDLAVISKHYWLLLPGIILIFLPAWLVNWLLRKNRGSHKAPRTH